MSIIEEEILLKNLKKKCSKSQTFVYRKYYAVFHEIAARYARRTIDIDDILQNAFLKIFDKSAQYSGRGTFRGWMSKIVVNEALSFYNKQKKHEHSILENPISIEEFIDESSYLNSDKTTYKEILKSINKLSPGTKQIFQKIAIEGYSHREIANLFGCSESTSRTQYYRARKILQKDLKYLL